MTTSPFPRKAVSAAAEALFGNSDWPRGSVAMICPVVRRPLGTSIPISRTKTGPADLTGEPAGIGWTVMQRMAPGYTWRFLFVDVIVVHHRRVGEGRGIGDEGFKKFAGIAHRHRIRHHGL